MIGLAMLGLLWALKIDSDLLSEEPFLWVQNGEKHTQTYEPRISEKHPCPDWKGRFSRICSGVIGVITLRQTDPSLEFPLSDTISWRFLGLVSIRLNPWFAWIPCLPGFLGFIDPGKYSAVIVIFLFKRYWQISLLIAVNSWFFVPPIFIKDDRAVILSMWMWTGIASFSFNLKDIIANLAALNSKKFMWNFRSSVDHGPPVVSPWQNAPQPCNDASCLWWGRNYLQSPVAES